MIVLDASVAIKWFVEEEGSDEAKNILMDLQNHPQKFIVPELFFIEMLSVLSRLVSSLPTLHTTMNNIENLGLIRIGHGHDIIQKACELVFTTGLSAYDALYAATADLTRATWVTADKKAHQKIAHLQISSVL